MINNWQEVRLGDVCSLIAGYAFKSQDFGNYTTKVIKIADITPPYVDNKKLVGVDISKYDESKLNRFLVCEGDFVFAMTGATIGKIGKLLSGTAYINQRVLLFNPSESIIDKKYLYYVLHQIDFMPFILNHIDSQTAQPNISATSVGKYSFSLPPLPVQRAIAATLSCLDNKIELNRRINANLEAQAQAIFKSWFVDFEPSIEYIEHQLSEFCTLIKGKKPVEIIEKEQKDYLPYLTIVSLTTNKTEYANPAKMVIAEKKDILMVMDGASSGTVHYGQNGIVASTFAKVAIKDKNLREIVCQMLKYNENEIKRYTTGSAIPHSDKNFILQMRLSLPKDFLEIAELFASIRQQIISNTAQSRTLAAIRDALLPKLMSGEIEVKEKIP